LPKPTQLPARYERLIAWQLDRRRQPVGKVTGDLFEVWQDWGGIDALPVQKRSLAERVVFLRHRCLAYEAAAVASRIGIRPAGEACEAERGQTAALGGR
jgi:hypothetical protein